MEQFYEITPQSKRFAEYTNHLCRSSLKKRFCRQAFGCFRLTEKSIAV